MKITTPRLIIREFKEKDIADIVANRNSLNVLENHSLIHNNKKDVRSQVLLNQKQVGKKKRENYSLGIELKSNHKLIGGIDIYKVDRFLGKATMGYWLGKDYWRQGIMYEAAQAMIEFAFNKLELKRIDLDTSTKNIPSNGLIKKLGFRYEGTRRKYHGPKAKGTCWHNANFYGLLASKYKTK
ncbi:MAG: GNAT family protein [Nanoarchaeota archaeon]|nr:GNAT family protein [Nanoarchaeota archaeon]